MEFTGPAVVVIDDDESVRRALRRLILSFGLDVEAFATAEDYLAAAPGSSPDCLIVDMRLPGLSGIELQRCLAAAGRATPFVFISAHGDEQTRREASAAGAAAFLQKPFDERALLEAVVRCFGMARRQAARP